MSTLRAFIQTPLERKRYTVSYERWMDETEVIFDYVIVTSPTTDPPLVAENAFTSGADKEISFFIKGGVSGYLYDVRLIATTSDGQVKEDVLQMAVA